MRVTVIQIAIVIVIVIEIVIAAIYTIGVLQSKIGGCLLPDTILYHTIPCYARLYIFFQIKPYYVIPFQNWGFYFWIPPGVWVKAIPPPRHRGLQVAALRGFGPDPQQAERARYPKRSFMERTRKGNLHIYLSIYRSIYRSIVLSIDRSTYLSIYLSIHLSIYISMCLSLYINR